MSLACFLAFRFAVRSAIDLQIVLEFLLSLLVAAVEGRTEYHSLPSTAGDATAIDFPGSSSAAIAGAVGVLARGFGCFTTF